MASSGPKHGSVPATELVHCANPEAAIDLLIKLYDGAIAQIEKDFESFAKGDVKPYKKQVYPYLGIEVESVAAPGQSTLAFGKIPRPGLYGTTITQPRLFRAYLIEQLEIVLANSKGDLYVGKSHSPIPLTFAVDGKQLIGRAYGDE